MELKHDAPTDRRTRQGIVKLLCEAGVDVSDQRLAKPSVLHTAASENDLDICKILVDSGADKTAVDSTENTPLHVAVNREKPLEEMVGLLCHQKTLNAPNKTGFTPLHLAAEKGDLKVVRTLVQAGADINVQAPSTKLTPLGIARHYKQHRFKHQPFSDFQGVMDFLHSCGQSKMEQKDRQPTRRLVRGRTAPPDEDKSQLKLRCQLKEQEEEGEELKKRIRTLEEQIQQYQDKLYPGGCPMAMSERHRQLLTLNHRNILSDLHISIVIPALREKGVLTQDMEEEIRSCKTQNGMNRKLLDILPTRGQAAFYVFRQALREDPGSEHLAVLLNEEESSQPGEKDL
ncbi:ANKK1 [Branchiostoma lanceolatum]|uniref:ANKK1 protein n=1 Tax=Branchiostoma lanceolatum TaxID=7740 RepID=A0A8J9ZYW1_BRALA|nr:ANKK1 [Branchiostoma lanceolatum]